MLWNISLLWTDYVPTAGWSLNPQCNGIWRWGLWEIIRIRWGHVSGASMVGFLLEEEEEKKKKKKSSFNLSLSVSLPPLCKDTARRCYLQAREESSHQNPTMRAFWYWTSILQRCEKIDLHGLSHGANGLLLWQPELTDIIDNQSTYWNSFTDSSLQLFPSFCVGYIVGSQKISFKWIRECL